MDPFLYVQEEFENVSRALAESLRHDYGPDKTIDYYDECQLRLAGIEEELHSLRENQGGSTSSLVSQLWDLANRLTLIERSHLGEFSWPFADAIRNLAIPLLSEEEGLEGRIEPIIHMIAEGTNYQILSEHILGPNKKRRLFTVAFPRQLKHHVLMHALFGHELGHATFYSARSAGLYGDSGQNLSRKIVSVLRREGPLENCASVMQWLGATEAPEAVKAKIAGGQATIDEDNLKHWLVELVCDLFGLMIFGPPFAAAHRTYLEPSCRSPFEIEIQKTSHPAYAIRRNLLISALAVKGWTDPIATKEAGEVFEAEQSFLKYIANDPFDPWASVFTSAQLEEVLELIAQHFQATQTSEARRPDEKTLVALVRRIEANLPPIHEEIDADGRSSTYELKVEEQLYAGWTYWLGREKLGDGLSFYQLNQLCDLALLQQQAIELSNGRRSL